MWNFQRIAMAAVGIFAVAGISYTAYAKELRFAHFFPATHPMHVKAFVPMAEELAKISGGDLTIRIYPAGALGKGAKQQYKRAVNGVADITMGLHGYTDTIFPRTMIIAQPGMAHSARDATCKIWAAMKLLKPEYKRVKLLAAYANAPVALHTRSKAVRSLDDVKGMKIRISSAADAPNIDSWGAVPVQLPITDAYGALDTGIVDGVLNSPSGLRAWKLYEPSKFITLNVPGSVTAFYIIMNQNSWKSLTEQQKKQLEQVTGREFSLKAAKVNSDAAEAGIAIAKKAGVEFITLFAKERERFMKAAAPTIDDVLDDLEKKGIQARKIYAAMKSGGC